MSPREPWRRPPVRVLADDGGRATPPPVVQVAPPVGRTKKRRDLLKTVGFVAGVASAFGISASGVGTFLLKTAGVARVADIAEMSQAAKREREAAEVVAKGKAEAEEKRWKQVEARMDAQASLLKQIAQRLRIKVKD